MNNRDIAFELLPYLKADLKRAYFIKTGSVSHPKKTRLWMGVLAPRFLPILLCRVAYFFHTKNMKQVAKLVSFFNFFTFGIEIALSCRIGKGLYLPHTHGTVIGAVEIGENATIFQGVTIGSRELDLSFDPTLRPQIGDGVVIGSGAKILGGISVGNTARIGANAVVLASVPAKMFAVGVPAKNKWPS